MKMKKLRKFNALLIAGLCGMSISTMTRALSPQGTAFTYQGQLRYNSLSVTGPVDLEFRLFDAALSGAQVGPVLTATNVPLVGGRFA
jgi:hypothetical protein